MFELKKIISSFIIPPGLFILISSVAAIWYLFKKEKKLFIIFLSAALVMYIFSAGFILNFFICRDEGRMNASSSSDGDVIVVLSGGNSSFNDPLTNTESLSEASSSRLFTAYRLHIKTSLPIIVTGGRIGSSPSDAEISEKILLSLGVSRKKIFVENSSSDTYQNAVFSKVIADKNNFKKPVIVTESLHIPRSVYLFKKAGFSDVSYYPSSYSCHGRINFMDFLPDSYYNESKYFHELIGIYFYKLFL